MTTTTEKLLAAIDEIESLRSELKKKKETEKNKQTMEKLNYRFPSTIKHGIKTISDDLEMSESDIARVAMYLGMKELLSTARKSDGVRIAKGTIHINKIRIMLDKESSYKILK